MKQTRMFLHFFQQFHLSHQSLTPNNHSPSSSNSNSNSNSSSFKLFFYGSHHVVSLCCTTLYALNWNHKRNLCFYVFNSQVAYPPNKNSPFSPTLTHHPIRMKKQKRREEGSTLLIWEESHLCRCCVRKQRIQASWKADQNLWKRHSADLSFKGWGLTQSNRIKGHQSTRT